MADPRLVTCEVNGCYCLWLRFADGVEGRVDFLNLLELGAFSTLRNPDRFAEAQMQDKAVTWPSGVRVDAGALYTALLSQGCKPNKPGARCKPVPMSQEQLVRITGDREYLLFRRQLLKSALAAVAKRKGRAEVSKDLARGTKKSKRRPE